MVPCRSASVNIVLNFTTKNVLPFLPTLFCLKKTGPGDVSPMQIATNKNGMHSTARPRAEKKMSKRRFEKEFI
jgi:hypothetical protein